MKPRRRLLILLLGLSALTAAMQGSVTTRGQNPPPAPAPTFGAVASTERALEAREAQMSPVHADHVSPQAKQRQTRRSIVHHYPYPYPGYYHGDDTAGFRNPSGVGRYAEYYPPGNESQLEREHVPAAPIVAQFDTNPATNRQEQIQATQVGVQRYNSIQNSIDNYARPTMGYGFGVGGFGGFW